MAIQQVTSSGGNGIMSFLFHDEGGMEGTVSEGAGFASTLHQLLGEPDATQAESADAASQSALAPELPESGTVPRASLASALEALANNFTLPAHGAALHSQANLDVAAEGQEHEQPFWGLAPFADVTLALREHHVDGVDAEATLSQARAAANDAAHMPPNAAFGKGIRNLIELARDAEQLAGQLSQGAPLPVPLAPASGMTAPASGKTLPPSYRQAANAANLLNTPGQTRGVQATVTEALPSAAGDVGFDVTLAGANGFVLDASTGEARGTQNQSSAAFAPIIQGLRGESTLPGATRSAAAPDNSPATPLFDSPHVAGTEAWFEDLGTRVEWLNDMNIDRAELQLHPAELGLLEINISTGEDGTAVSFVTHNSEARELIEASMPKLRELLQNQGLQLGQSQVSQQSAGQRQGHDAQADRGAAPADSTVEEAAPQRRTVYVRDPNRIDHYV